MLRDKIKNFGMICICFLVCLFAPMTVKAGESVTGGETFEMATEIAWDKEYTTTNDEGWFKVRIPENLYYIGAGYDKFTTIEGYAGKYTPYHDNEYVSGNTKLGEYTEYWDCVTKGVTSELFLYYYSKLTGDEYAYFKVATTKAECCTFRLIYGSSYTNQNRYKMSLNQDYTEKYYRAYYDGAYQHSHYQFVAANTGKCKVILKSENGTSKCKVTYKDGTVAGEFGEGEFTCGSNQMVETVLPVTQGMVYYLEVWASDIPGNSTSPVNITFQVSNTPVSSITLNSNSLTMNKGEQFQLTTTVAPDNAVDKTVTYSTSNPQVAIVSEEGIVTAVCGGTATITVDSNDGSGVQAFCQVTVIPKLVTRLDLDHDYIEADLCACEEDGYQLRATAYPVDADNTEVTFTSSNTAIVSVDKTTGMLTLKKPGTATITCITNDGSNLTKTCKVVLKQSHLLGEKKTINKIKYKVTSDTLRGGTVAVYGVSDKNAKSYTVQNSIMIDGYSYKITAINDKAFANCKKLTDVVLGTNVKSIGKEAFSNCKKLKTLTIKSKKIKFVGKNAFKNIYSKATIKVPSSCLSKYKKLFKGKGQKSSVKIKKM